MSRYETLQIILTAFILFAAIVAACIYGCQLSEMQKATLAATKAANAAQESITLTRQMGHLDQRAWVATTSATGKPEEGKTMPIAVTMRNTGKTFAKNVAIAGCVRHVAKDAEPDFDREIASVVPKSVGVMPPNGDYFSEGPTTTVVTKEHFENIKEGRLTIFVFGKITYDDIFKCPHWTLFCYRMNPVNWVWEIYKSHNDTDEKG
jgi:hypothetical protein